MRCRILTILCGLSLLLCVAVCVLWVRSYFAVDRMVVCPDPDERIIYTHRGRLSFRADHSWPELNDRNWGEDYESGLWGFGAMAGSISRGHDNWISAHYTKWSFIPLWFLALVFSVAPARAVRSYLIKWRRARAGNCPCCGYDLRASPQRCPECGTENQTKVKTDSTTAFQWRHAGPVRKGADAVNGRRNRL